MASQEQIPVSLPDTRNADAVLTRLQKVPSQQPTSSVWGRLYPLRLRLPSLDLVNDNSYTFGRPPRCNIYLTNKNKIQERLLNGISRTHFCIYKERIGKTNKTVVYLEDFSRNGTFVNRNLVGRGKRVVIKHDSMIALLRRHFTVYVFVSTHGHKTTYELPQKLKQEHD